jgi:hypothetical protein
MRRQVDQFITTQYQYIKNLSFNQYHSVHSASHPHITLTSTIQKFKNHHVSSHTVQQRKSSMCQKPTFGLQGVIKGRVYKNNQIKARHPQKFSIHSAQNFTTHPTRNARIGNLARKKPISRLVLCCLITIHLFPYCILACVLVNQKQDPFIMSVPRPIITFWKMNKPLSSPSHLLVNHIPVDNLSSLLILLAEVDASSISNRLLLAASLHLDNGHIHHHDDEHEEDAREEAHGCDASRGATLDFVGEGAGDDLDGALLGRAGAVDPLTSLAVAEIAGRKGAHFDGWRFGGFG